MKKYSEGTSEHQHPGSESETIPTTERLGDFPFPISMLLTHGDVRSPEIAQLAVREDGRAGKACSSSCKEADDTACACCRNIDLFFHPGLAGVRIPYRSFKYHNVLES